MKSGIITTYITAFAAIAFSLSAVRAGETSGKAITPPEDDLSSYIYMDAWAASLKGNIGVAGRTSSIDVGFDDIVDNLDAAFAGGFGFQKGKWGLLTEVFWLKVSTDAPTPGSLFKRADIGVEQVMVDGHISYRFFECPQGKGHLDVIGGARYMYMDTTLGFVPGAAPRRINVGGSESWWDAYGGIKGRYDINDKWFLPFRGDVGGGDSSLVWQAIAGVGYQFDSGFDMRLAYRYMSYDYSGGGFTYDVETHGPIFIVGYSF